MIKIKTGTVLKDFQGKNLKNGVNDLTIGIVVSAILGGQVSNPTLGWVFGKKFATEKEVELKAEDVVFVKTEVEKNKEWTALVIGQALEIIEGKDENK